MNSLKYLIATFENPYQISLRNLLNPCGYTFLAHCKDSVSLIRAVRGYQPDFVLIDLTMQMRELKTIIETLDEEMLCFSILLGEDKDMDIMENVRKSKSLYFCRRSVGREVLINTIEMAEIGFSRVLELNNKLKEATQNFENRKAIERAKWLLMERDGISEAEAYDKMRKKSMDNRLTMKAIADAIIFTHEIGNV